MKHAIDILGAPRSLVWALPFILVGLLAGCGGGEGNDGGGDPIAVGAILPLTGPAAPLGKAWEQGVELAVDELNRDGGVLVDGERHPIEVSILDDESTPAGAQRAVQQHLTDGVRIFLGPTLSASFDTAFSAIEEEGESLVISPATAAEGYLESDDDRLLFKSQAPLTGEGGGIELFVDALQEEYQPERVALLQSQDPLGDILAPAMTEAFEAAGVEIVYSERVPTDNRDFGSFLSAIRREDPDVVVGPYLDTLMVPLVDQAVQTGFTSPVFATYGGSSAGVAGHEDQVRDFVWTTVTRAVDNPDDESVAEFRKRYKEKYGRTPPSIAFFALSLYDPLLALGEAMETAKSTDDLAAIDAALKDVSSWEGQVLDLDFDETGLAHYTFQLGTLEDGKTTFSDHGTF